MALQELEQCGILRKFTAIGKNTKETTYLHLKIKTDKIILNAIYAQIWGKGIKHMSIN